MKSEVSVNAGRDNPKRLNQNLLKYLNRNAILNKLEDFKKVFRPKVSYSCCSVIHIKPAADLVTR